MLMRLRMNTFRSNKWPLLWLWLWEGVLGQLKGILWSPGGEGSRPPREVRGLNEA